MKKVIAMSFLLMTIFGSVKLSAQNTEKLLLGTWDYTAEYAPIEYQKGQIVFFEEDGEAMANIVNGEQTIDTQDLSIDGAKVEFVAFVEYEPVTIELELKDGKLSGNVDSSEGVMPVSLEKAKE